MVFLSSEWLLTRKKLPNGSGVIVLRAILTSVYIYLGVLVLRNVLDPEPAWTFSPCELRAQIMETLPWFGAIFAGIYAALYARFASQWTYLANLYNLIKQTEARTAGNYNRALKNIIAEWKAGFLEDAEEVHLLTKRVFVSVMKLWGEQEAVKEQFIKNTPGGEVRFDALMRDVMNAYDLYARRYGKA